jgi:hypothetical protein
MSDRAWGAVGRRLSVDTRAALFVAERMFSPSGI